MHWSCCRTGRSFTAVWQKWGQTLHTQSFHQKMPVVSFLPIVFYPNTRAFASQCCLVQTAHVSAVPQCDDMHGNVCTHEIRWCVHNRKYKQRFYPAGFKSFWWQMGKSFPTRKQTVKVFRLSQGRKKSNFSKKETQILFPHLDAQDVRPGFDKLICKFQVVVQRVLLPHRVRDVACVRDGRLHYAACSSSSLHAQQHVRQVVQGIEHAEDVHAVLLGHLAEPGRDGKGRKIKMWANSTHGVMVL